MNYPYDLVSIVRQKTFSVESHLVSNFKESPLKIFDSSFSRFVFNIINKDAPTGKKSAFFNLHVEEIPKIELLTKIALEAHIKAKSTPMAMPEGVSGKGLPFTVRFHIGCPEVKGKTAAEILLKDYENGKALLKKQYEFLKKELSKYPQNQKEMDAIREACDIDFKSMSASKSVSPSPASQIFQLFSIGARPLTRKQNDKGLSFCYEGSIIWDTSKNYPVEITISNYYAPVQKKENGTLNVLLSQKDVNSEVKHEFKLTDTEWLYVVSRMSCAVKDFQTINFKKAMEIAETAAKANREQAGSSEQSA